ncbi:lactonase family protein [Streptomyces apocyni]|uniref:lactonase family protein n=1 Tax=Streptomyces apocyni TaxID=2654677 RepID=UPI0012EA0315|nr:lactonase family protein [Streptomyces apocyni]
MGGMRAYIGSFTSAGGRGITTASIDEDTGALTALSATDVLADPSYLALSDDGEVLYAVSESERGQVAAFGVRAERPEPLGAPVAVGGASPTHLALAAGHLVTANYGSGSVSWLPVRAGGQLGAAGAGAGVLRHTGSGPDPERQRGPHAHQVLPDPSGRWVLSVDLGTDSVRVCSLVASEAVAGKAVEGGAVTGEAITGEAGALAELRTHREVVLRPGSGPRHLAFHPRGDLAYVVHELSATVTCCRWDAQAGHLEPLGETRLLHGGPVAGDAYPSGLVVSTDGRFLWAATRGQDVISVLALDGDGVRPRLVTTVASGGHWPRDLALHPSGRFLYAAHERSGDVTWFAVDPESGALRRAGAIEAPAASCVVFG